MKKHLLSVFGSFTFLLLSFAATAQGTTTTTTLEADRIDNKPVYRQFNDKCILDKIEYKKDRTIFHFRYRASSYTSIWLYDPQGSHPWFLKDEANGKEYGLLGVYNVRRNNRLTHKEVNGGVIYLSADAKKEKTYFECEVHFERLPQEVAEVDLIEGKGMEEAWNHFHCFDIKISPLKEKTAPVVAPIALEDLVLAPKVDLFQEVVAPIQQPAANTPVTIQTQTNKQENTNTIDDVTTTSNWTVFPTPATNLLQVKQSDAQEAQLTLTNLNGQVIWTGLMQGNNTSIDVSEFPAGAYLLQHTAAGNSTSQKVLIQ